MLGTWFIVFAAPDKDVELISGAAPVGKPVVVLRPVFAYGPHVEDDSDDFSVDSILVPDFPQGSSAGSFDPFFGLNLGFMTRIQGLYLLIQNIKTLSCKINSTLTCRANNVVYCKNSAVPFISCGCFSSVLDFVLPSVFRRVLPFN